MSSRLIVLFFLICCATAEIRDEEFDLFPRLPLGVIDTDNVVCKKQSRVYIENLRNLSLWAHEIRDSTAKSLTGLLSGSIAQFGSYYECLHVAAPFDTQYCITSLVADIPSQGPSMDRKSLDYDPNESVLLKLYDKKDPSQQARNIVLMGWCMPASCREDDLQNHVNKYLKNADFFLKRHNVTYTAHLNENSCQRRGEYTHYDHVDFSFGLVIIILIVLVSSSSLYDHYRNKEEDKLKEGAQASKLFLSFSIQRNFKKLPRADGSNKALSILYGIRVFCICMIIMDHRFGTHLSSAVLNFDMVEEQYRSSVGTLFFHGDLFVDSFFVLSGLLVTYSLLVQYDKKITNPAIIIFLRYMRLTPLYAFVIFYYATLFKYTGSGPMWKTIINPEVQDCRENWWTNLLYISNYVNEEHMCMVHSWYLPCDFHYFVVAVLLCLAINKNKKLGLTSLGVVIFLSLLSNFLVVLLHELPAVLFFYPEFLRAPKMQRDFSLVYSKSHTRAGPYFIGMIAGYLFYRMKDSGKCLKNVYSRIILVSSVVIMAATIVTGTIFYDPYHEYNGAESALYSALHRSVWALGSIGIIYVASYGHAKFIYRFLSWKPWIPLSKLVYGAYLIHMQYQIRAVARRGGVDVVGYFDMICYALSDIAVAFSTALVLYLAIEAPFRNIIALLLVPQKEPKPVQNNNNLPAQENKETKEDVPSEVSCEATCDSHL
ncbi:unnamed protein product [Acanthoscelides obtectus]|uniref:Nose resistant-to-fluoxetine protein N-terminal domain-containing protein n=2 Tax=Acanthoscelides obtectus TaxID=200917 RepID=A0A9P0PEK3_ACAOB|nr:unnamed protein product [Acanthoscelides obtectus]CAK1676359.1 Nose resistant to fluoxetine protein 6 [Acanthoscelides obtectus]